MLCLIQTYMHINTCSMKTIINHVMSAFHSFSLFHIVDGTLTPDLTLDVVNSNHGPWLHVANETLTPGLVANACWTLTPGLKFGVHEFVPGLCFRAIYSLSPCFSHTYASFNIICSS
jgi:hypothetical protein